VLKNTGIERKVKDIIQNPIGELFDKPAFSNDNIDDAGFLLTSLLNLKTEAQCNTCWITMKAVETLLTSRVTMDALEGIAVNICHNVVKNDTICPPVIKKMGDVLLPVLSGSLLSADSFCGEFL
jgi:hypothetical protein